MIVLTYTSRVDDRDIIYTIFKSNIGECLIWVRQNDQNETDMSETRGLLLKLMWVRHLDPNLHRYDWDAQKNFSSLFLILTQSQVCKIKMQEQNFFGRLSHICASLGRGVAVISVSTLSFASQSYRSKLCLKRLTHISFSSKPQVSLISVPFGSFCRTHIRHHPK